MNGTNLHSSLMTRQTAPISFGDIIKRMQQDLERYKQKPEANKKYIYMQEQLIKNILAADFEQQYLMILEQNVSGRLRRENKHTSDLCAKLILLLKLSHFDGWHLLYQPLETIKLLYSEHVEICKSKTHLKDKK